MYSFAGLIEGEFEYLTNNNILYYNVNNQLKTFNLSNNNLTVKTIDHNRIYGSYYDSNQLIEQEINWNYQDKIITIMDKDNKILKQLKNTGEADQIEVVGLDMISKIPILIVILSSSSNDKVSFIIIPFKYNKENISIDRITKIKSYRDSTLLDDFSEICFTSKYLKKQFMLIENNEIIYNKNLISKYRLLSDNKVITTFFDKEKEIIYFNTPLNEEYYIRYNSKIEINLFNTTFINKEIYLVNKENLMILDHKAKNKFNLIKLDEEIPLYSIITIDVKFICMIYHNGIKILKKN